MKVIKKIVFFFDDFHIFKDDHSRSPNYSKRR